MTVPFPAVIIIVLLIILCPMGSGVSTSELLAVIVVAPITMLVNAAST